MDSIDANADLELIAGLIDGRLSGDERARAMKLLADSDEALELYASTWRQQQTASGVKVVSITTARRWRPWRVIAPLAAAAAVLVVLVPRLVGPGAQPVSAREYAVALAQDPGFASGLRAGWEERGWTVTRGRATGATSQEESRPAFRLGVRTGDLQIALQRGDTALASLLASEIQETLTGIRFSERVGARYAELGSRLSTDPVPRSIERATSIERELRELVRSASFSFGQWVGAAELATKTHDAPFFESRQGRRFLQSASAADSLAADDARALKAIDTRVKQGLTVGALDEMHELLQTIIRRRGG